MGADSPEVNRLGPQPSAEPGVVEQLVDEVGHPLGRAGGPLEVGTGHLVGSNHRPVTGHLEETRQGRQRVEQVVAHLAGKVREVVVGALQLAGHPQQLEHVDHLAGEDVEDAQRVGGQVTRLLVEDAERADGHARGRAQLARGVEPHPGNDTGDERVLRKAVVETRIAHPHRPGAVEDGCAHGVLGRARRRLEAHGGHLVLLPVVDQVDGGRGHPAHLGGDLHEPLEVPVEPLADAAVLLERLAPGNPLDICPLHICHGAPA